MKPEYFGSYDNSDLGINRKNFANFGRGVTENARDWVSDTANTLGSRFDAYQNEQAQKAQGSLNPLSHVPLPVTAGLVLGGVHVADAANRRGELKLGNSRFREMLQQGGVTDNARLSQLEKLRDAVYKPGVDPHLNSLDLLNKGYAQADIDLVKNTKSQADRLASFTDKMTGSGGAGMDFVKGLDQSQQKLLDNYVRNVSKGSPTSEGFAKYLSGMGATGKVDPARMRGFMDVGSRMSTQDPAKIFSTVKAVGEHGPLPTFTRNVSLAQKLNIQHKPSLISKALSMGRRFFKGASITPDMVLEKLAVDVARPLLGHAQMNSLTDTINKARENMATPAEKMKIDNNKDWEQRFNTRLDEFEKKMGGKFDYNQPKHLEQLGSFMGHNPNTDEEIRIMNSRYGEKALGQGPTGNRMTPEQIAKFNSKGLKTNVDELSWNPQYNAYTTDLKLRNRPGVGFDPKTGGTMELTPLEIADKEFMRNRPQATTGRDGTWRDALNPREMVKNVANAGRRVTEGAGLGAMAGGTLGWSTGGFPGMIAGAGYGAGAGAIGGSGLALAENTRSANTYNPTTRSSQRQKVPATSNLFDMAKYWNPTTAFAGDAIHTGANLADRAIYGNDRTNVESLGENAYDLVKEPAKKYGMRAYGAIR